ncbi:YdcF family protein [Paraclostridium sp. AKS81]|uniref:YdcF family protein n=1 Tax=Paraclostridium sp. AKS81 TaxID=2876117 RepID=UPI0021E00E7F|nr:YdcF family protein [Paraclostridium sp. AKS81]MCU9810564.1 YdcF family protein [Paraclostridium sp. AKS81]
MIVLGASVKNTTPSLTLRGRLDKAIQYLDESKDDCYIVVSGGKGSDEKLSEAKAMENYLVEHGVNKDKIILEDKSTNTYENFKYSKEKIEKTVIKI